MLLAYCALACSLDERVLVHEGASAAGNSDHPSTSGSGNGTGGAGSNAGTGAGSGGGTAGRRDPGAHPGGQTSTSPQLVDGCADLDSDGVGDCNVTLLNNSNFQSDVEGWTGVDDATLTWDPENALGDTPSGCARLHAPGSGAVIYRAAQCVEVPSNTIIIAYANARVEKALPGTQTTHAELEVTYFDNADCSGNSTGYFATPPSEGSDAWVIVQAGGVPGPKTAAVSVALVGIRPDATNQQSICFDNLMLKPNPLPDGG